MTPVDLACVSCGGPLNAFERQFDHPVCGTCSIRGRRRPNVLSPRPERLQPPTVVRHQDQDLPPAA